MNPNVLIAAIAAGGSIVIAVTALLLNYRAFNSIGGKFASIERRLELIEADLKEFFKMLARHDTDISRLKGKAGLT
jgi:hypothetical protein